MSRSNQILWLLVVMSMLLSACQPISPTVSQTAPGTPETAISETPTDSDAVHQSAETAAQDSEAAEDISGFVDRDGVRIHYEVVGNGPPLVLAHWWTGSTEDWHLFGYVDGLKEHYRLILVDMRGHGQSDKPHDAAAYTAQVQAGDVVAVLDELGLEKAHFFGYSLGGTLGWALAHFAPERFYTISIGGDGAAGEDLSEMAAILQEMGAEEWAFAHRENMSIYEGKWRPELYELYAENDVEALALAAVELSNFDAWPDLPDMKMPILLVAGRSAEEFADMLRAADALPNGQLLALPNLDHVGTFLASEQIIPEIIAFLEQDPS